MSDILPKPGDEAGQPEKKPRAEGSRPSVDIDFGALPEIPEDGRSWRAEWWIATSHLRSKKQEAFVSLVTVLSILGVVAGVAVLNWVISVMTGFEVDLRDKILGTNAHVVVLRHGGDIVDHEDLIADIEQIDGVEAVAPFIYSEMMIRWRPAPSKSKSGAA